MQKSIMLCDSDGLCLLSMQCMPVIIWFFVQMSKYPNYQIYRSTKLLPNPFQMSESVIFLSNRNIWKKMSTCLDRLLFFQIWFYSVFVPNIQIIQAFFLCCHLFLIGVMESHEGQLNPILHHNFRYKICQVDDRTH